MDKYNQAALIYSTAMGSIVQAVWEALLNERHQEGLQDVLKIAKRAGEEVETILYGVFEFPKIEQKKTTQGEDTPLGGTEK